MLHRLVHHGVFTAVWYSLNQNLVFPQSSNQWFGQYNMSELLLDLIALILYLKLPFGVTIPATVSQRSEIPEGFMITLYSAYLERE